MGRVWNGHAHHPGYRGLSNFYKKFMEGMYMYWVNPQDHFLSGQESGPEVSCWVTICESTSLTI